MRQCTLEKEEPIVSVNETFQQQLQMYAILIRKRLMKRFKVIIRGSACVDDATSHTLARRNERRVGRCEKGIRMKTKGFLATSGIKVPFKLCVLTRFSCYINDRVVTLASAFR